MKLPLLPELWEVILHNIRTTKDLKNVSLVCSLFKEIVHEQLWNYPRLKCGISSQDIRKLTHLPIRSIDTVDFGKEAGAGFWIFLGETRIRGRNSTWDEDPSKEVWSFDSIEVRLDCAGMLDLIISPGNVVYDVVLLAVDAKTGLEDKVGSLVVVSHEV